MAETCGNCKFWLRIQPPAWPHTQDVDGVCRCLSPTGATWGQLRFPPVDSDDWCGKWEAIPADSPP